MLHIGFTGTQHGLTNGQHAALEAHMKRLRETHTEACLHHGDCIGADAEAHEIATRLGFEREIHPPTSSSKRVFCEGNRTHEPKAYLDRNHDIVDACSLLLATPSGPVEQRRSGTWATVRYARKKGKRIWLFFPDGACREEAGDVVDDLLGLDTSVGGSGVEE